MSLFARSLQGIVWGGVIGLLPWGYLDAQSLRGSRASIDRMASYAEEHGLYHYQTHAGIRKAVRRERLVPMTGSDTYRLHAVGHPYVKPATQLFVQRLGKQYHAACGEPLVVTSAIRPARAQPWNSTPRSVHPTGIAVDFRTPTTPACSRWLRRTLLSLERAGVLEATEEFSPPHFHVAVYSVPYRAYVKRLIARESRARLAMRTRATRTKAPVMVHVVRRGDTLWDVARQYQSSVQDLMRKNHLTSARIRPGQQLILPSRTSR